MEKNKWFYLSLICFLVGIAIWFPNLIFGYAASFWLLTFIINPLGILFGYMARSTFGMIVNAIMTGSFFILMAVGYLIAAVFGGKP